jgi:HPt (histidine-containing phosphotransfer) domain-containing protein
MLDSSHDAVHGMCGFAGEIRMPSVGPKIKSQLSHDPDMRELVEMFVEEMPARAAKLREVLTSQQWKELANEAHKLRGSAGGHGFATIGTVAGGLEDLVRNNTGKEEALLAQIRSRVDELVSMCERASV